MKFAGLLIFLAVACAAQANTNCDSVQNGDGELLRLNKHQLTLEKVQAGDILLFAKRKVKIVAFYTSGGPEQGVTILTQKGEKIDIWCTDENTPTED